MISKGERHILFTSRNCAKCGPYKALLQRAGVTIMECSVDRMAGQEMAAQYHVKTLPSLLAMQNGVPQKVFPGALTRQQIEEIFK
jgi:thioredoxin-like negative regulator of GroEL